MITLSYPIYTKLFWKIRLVYGLKAMEKELEEKLDLEAIIQFWFILLHLGTLQKSVMIIKPISFVVSLILEKLLTQCVGLTIGIV
jgi:hypothetical protein